MVKRPENRMDDVSKADPDSWTFGEMDIAEGGCDPEEGQAASQLETAKPQQQAEKQLMVDISGPTQLSSSCCYGRGKKLEDIVIPRLPKVFQDDYFPPADDYDLDKGFQSLQTATGRQGRQRQIQGIGRGKMLQDHSTRMETHQRPSNLQHVYGQGPAESVPPRFLPATDCFPDFDRPTTSSHDFFADNTNIDFWCRSVKDTKFCVQSKNDFPSLQASMSATSSPLHREQKHKSGPRKQRCSEDISSGMFEDAMEMPSAPSSDPLWSYTESAAEINKSSNAIVNLSGSSIKPSDTFVDLGGSSMNIMKKECTINESSVSNVSRNGDAQCSGAVAIGVQNNSSESDSIGGNNYVDTAFDIIQTKVKMHNEQHDVAAEDEAGAAETKVLEKKAKKKVPGGWKLDGPLVVHVDKVPKGLGRKLLDIVNTLAKVVEKEKKKSKLGGTAWRFRFETRENCEYVVLCLNKADDLFEGHTAALESFCVEEVN